jgi:hypothetical protein
VSPVEFLKLPLDEIVVHMHWTQQVVVAGDAAAEWQRRRD